MSQMLFRYRYLKTGDTAPNYTYEWKLDSETPPADAVIVEAVGGESIEIKQERKTNGHYWPLPMVFDVPVAKARYKDLVVPDYTNGLDVLGAHFDAADSDSGDELACGKLIVGKVGALVGGGGAGSTTVTIRSTKGILAPTKLGGVLDEGFYLSFGAEASAADANGLIGGNEPTGDLVNPDQELKEYEIKRIGSPVDVSGVADDVAITLFSALTGTVAPGTDANLVVRFIKQVIPITKGNRYDLGLETFISGNMPANKRFRIGYRNAVGVLSKTIRTYIPALY